MADALTCPVCHSADARRVEEARWRCNACDTLWVQRDGTPHIEVAGTPPVDRGARGLAVPLAAGAGLLALLGGLLVLAWPDPPAPVGTPPAELRQRLLDRSAIQRHPKIELVSTREGVTPSGETYWLTTYRNVDEIPISRPIVVASLYDDGGNLLASPQGASLLPELPPSDETVVLVRAGKDVTFERAEVRAKTPVVARKAPTTVRVGVDRLQVREADEDSVLVGTLLNLSDQQVRVTRIEAVGRTAHGEAVAFTHLDPRELILDGEQRAEVTIPVGDLILETPQYWTGYAVADPL